MIVDPILPPLPPGQYVITDHLIELLAKIPGALNAQPLEDGDIAEPVEGPGEDGPWILLPGGSVIHAIAHEDREQLLAVHIGDGPGFAQDQALLAKVLD